MSRELFDQVSQSCSKLVTQAYSTSFSIGIRLLHPTVRPHIYAIYGFVRLADEIVDSFHDFDKRELLDQFVLQTEEALEKKISLNPILHQFQRTVNTYDIDRKLIDAFLHSMKMDLDKKNHSRESYEEYILGSAEVVGLMCLQVFCEGDKILYSRLAPHAQRLGAAFQKVNFLRDIQADQTGLGRHYFPHWEEGQAFSEEIKAQIITEIKNDFKAGREGIVQLPRSCKTGVYAAYVYYRALLIRIAQTPSSRLVQSRIRINNGLKLLLLLYAGFRIKWQGLK